MTKSKGSVAAHCYRDSPHSPTSLPQTHVFHIAAEEMPNSIKNTCRALIIRQSLAGAQGQKQLCAFKSRWRWCPAPAAACQPGDRSTRVRLVLRRAAVFVTREAGRHRSLNQLAAVIPDLHHGRERAPLGPGQEAHPGSLDQEPGCRALCRIRLALPGLLHSVSQRSQEQSGGAFLSVFTSSANISSF